MCLYVCVYCSAAPYAAAPYIREGTPAYGAGAAAYVRAGARGAGARETYGRGDDDGRRRRSGRQRETTTTTGGGGDSDDDDGRRATGGDDGIERRAAMSRGWRRKWGDVTEIFVSAIYIGWAFSTGWSHQPVLKANFGQAKRREEQTISTGLWLQPVLKTTLYYRLEPPTGTKGGVLPPVVHNV